jgi:hypothetical protein
MLILLCFHVLQLPAHLSVLGRIYSHSNLAGTTLPCNTCFTESYGIAIKLMRTSPNDKTTSTFHVNPSSNPAKETSSQLFGGSEGSRGKKSRVQANILLLSFGNFGYKGPKGFGKTKLAWHVEVERKGGPRIYEGGGSGD